MKKVEKYPSGATWFAALALCALLTGCGAGEDPILGTGGSAQRAPTVTNVTPLNGAVAVSISTTVTATFDQPVAALTGTSSFTVTCAAPCQNPTGTVTLDATNTVATFTLTAGTSLTPLTLYTATVSGARSVATGLPLATPYVWSFTTAVPAETIRPSVTFTAPITTIPGPTVDVATNSAIVAAFTEDMAPATISATSFTVTCTAPCASPAGTVTYVVSSKSAVFTPAAALATNTTYTATITTAATDLAGNALAGNQALLPAASDYVWTFTTGATQDTTRPSVTLTVPATTNPGPTGGVPVNTAITAAFTEDMAPATISASSFTLTCTAPCASPAGTVTYVVSSKSAVFTPAAALAANTTYTATITTAATDLAGNALSGNQALPPAASDYIWTFTTGATPDTTRPRVTLTVPATTIPGPTGGVAINTAITAAFTEGMAPATITGTSFTVVCTAPCVSPTGNVSYASGSRTAVFTPATALAANTTYTATVTTAATDLAGNALAGNQGLPTAASNYVWTFATGATSDITPPTVISTNPTAGAAGICINKTVNATFSEPMDPLTITAANFTLAVTAGAPVIGVVTYDAATNIASFNPVANLIGTPATNYTVTIKGGAGGVKDVAGNVLAVDSVTTFTTNPSTCATAPSLGAAAPFGDFGGNATATNDGLATVINGDVGVNAASTKVTGFIDSGLNSYTITPNNTGLVTGLVYTLTAPPGSPPGAAVTQARADALTAFNSISPASLPGGLDVSNPAQCASCGGALGGPDELAGRTLPPGVYLSTSGTYDIGGVTRTTANLTLDAGGDANAVWVFQTAAGTGTLNVGLTGPAAPAVPIQVLLINGAQAKNVFWYVPAGATIGTGSTMVGTMLANAAISISTTGGTPPTAPITIVYGRAIALTAAVSITNTVINVPAQ